MTTLTFYTKPECTLCDEALEAIELVRRSVPFDLEKVDVSSDEQLVERYGDRVPVVEIDGVRAFEYHVTEDELEARLQRPKPTSGAGEAATANDMGAHR